MVPQYRIVISTGTDESMSAEWLQPGAPQRVKDKIRLIDTLKILLLCPYMLAYYFCCIVLTTLNTLPCPVAAKSTRAVRNIFSSGKEAQPNRSHSSHGLCLPSALSPVLGSENTQRPHRQHELLIPTQATLRIVPKTSLEKLAKRAVRREVALLESVGFTTWIRGSR
jgi:hypothetical protein